jgi:hypothetical protein
MSETTQPNLTPETANTAIARVDPSAPPMVSQEVNDTTALLRMAIEQKVSPENLEKLIALKERVDREAARKAFIVAMSGAQAEIPKVLKDKFNTQTNSKYASMESVQNAIKASYLRHGFKVTASEAEAKREKCIRVQLIVEHVAGHSEVYYREGEVDNTGMAGKVNKTMLHGGQSTFTYLHNRLLQSVFGITATDTADKEDDDGGGMVFIDEKQIIILREMMQSYGADERKFLAALEVANLNELPASRYREAFWALKAKAAAKESNP